VSDTENKGHIAGASCDQYRAKTSPLSQLEAGEKTKFAAADRASSATNMSMKSQALRATGVWPGETETWIICVQICAGKLAASSIALSIAMVNFALLIVAPSTNE
jgi:hypothetical protein